VYAEREERKQKEKTTGEGHYQKPYKKDK